MSKCLLTTLGLLLLLAEASCGKEKDKEDKDPKYKYLYAFGAVVLSAVCRLVLLTLKIPVPYSLMTITLGIVVGTVSKVLHGDTGTNIALRLVKHELKQVYMPFVIFNTAFCIDVHSFLRSLPQILVISIPVALICGVAVGTIMQNLLDPTWSVADGFLFGAILCTIYPMETLRYYNLVSVPQLRQVNVLLEGETIVVSVVSIYMFEALTLYIGGWTGHWYHYVMGALRLIVLGIPTGYICGLVGSALMKMTYNNHVTLMVLTIAMCYSSHDIGERVASAGVLCTIITGIMMSKERTTLPSEIEPFVRGVWLVLTAVLNALLYICVGLASPHVVRSEIVPKDYVLAFVTYALNNVARFASFALFGPVLHRMGYGLSFRNLIFCSWMGMKNPFIFSLALELDEVYEDRLLKAKLFFLNDVIVYLLFLLVNVTALPVMLRLLGILDISPVRQANMNYCMKHILLAREKKIAILKMDRFLSDANWSMVMHMTLLEHPYKAIFKKDMDQESVDDIYRLGVSFATCPDCKKELPIEPTPREMKDLTHEARMRVLKLKKISYSRQYENGMISKEGVRNLHNAVQAAMDTEEALIHVDGILKLFQKEGFFYRFVRDRFVCLTRSVESNIRPPRKHWRRVCYYTIKSPKFKIFIYAVIICNLALVLHDLVGFLRMHTIQHYFTTATKLFVSFIFFGEFCLKVIGYSWIYVCAHGFKRYFTSFWDVVSFIVMLAVFADTFLTINEMFHYPLPEDTTPYTFYVLCTLRLLCTFRFLQCLSLCCEADVRIVKTLERKIDKHRAMAYELGKNYLTVEEEILENLHYIIDNAKIREALRQRFEADKEVLTKALGLAQKDRSKVYVSVKTLLVMKSVLNSMKQDIKELKVSGWVDEIEYLKLMSSLNQQYRHVKGIKFVPHSAPSVIFNEIAWMGDDEQLTKFLYDNVSTNRFDAGQVVVDENAHIEGIYVLITGLLKVEYKPTQSLMDNLADAGVLPIVDYISFTQYDETISDYIVTGNCIGELSTLTLRPYDCRITAECHSQVYVLKKEVLARAMKMDPDPIKGLECRIWLTVSFRIAIPILMNVPAYRSYTQEQIKFTLERAFMPNITNFRVFIVNEMMEDVLLIEGVVIDYNTKDVYTAPCYIPRSVQRLILPKSSVFDLEKHVTTETRLLVIPAKDVNEYEIMIEEEATCELLSKSSSKCLQHIIASYAPGRLSKTRSSKVSRILDRKRSRQVSPSQIMNKTKSKMSKITISASSKLLDK